MSTVVLYIQQPSSIISQINYTRFYGGGLDVHYRTYNKIMLILHYVMCIVIIWKNVSFIPHHILHPTDVGTRV